MASNLNPYNGNINPSTSEGLDLFLKATKERKDELNIKFHMQMSKILSQHSNPMHESSDGDSLFTSYQSMLQKRTYPSSKIILL